MIKNSEVELNQSLLENEAESNTQPHTVVSPFSERLKSIRVENIDRPGHSKILNRLPLLVLIRPRQVGDLLEAPDTYDVDLLDVHSKTYNVLYKSLGFSNKLSNYEKKWLTHFGKTQVTDPNTPLLIRDDQKDIYFRIRSRLVQDNTNNFSLWPNPNLTSWCTGTQIPKPYISISADTPDDLFQACFFDGHVYLAYGDKDTVVLKPFDLLSRVAEHTIRFKTATMPCCCIPKGDEYKLRDARTIIPIYDRDDEGHDDGIAALIPNPNYVHDVILPVALDLEEIPPGSGVKILQAAHDLLMSPALFETRAQASTRRTLARETLDKEFPSQATSTTYLTLI